MLNKLPIVLVFISGTVTAQYQLVMMKNDNVIGRYKEGDFIRYSTSTPKNFVRDQIIKFTDTTLVTRNDTLALPSIRLVEYKPRGLTIEKLGKDFVVAGTALFLADWINVTIVQDNPYDFDRGVVVTSASLVVAGIILRVIGKEYVKIKRRTRLLLVSQGSPLYQ